MTRKRLSCLCGETLIPSQPDSRGLASGNAKCGFEISNFCLIKNRRRAQTSQNSHVFLTLALIH